MTTAIKNPPYTIEKSGDEYCVILESTGESVGCSETMEAAQEHLAALEAAVEDAKTMPDTAIKSATLDTLPSQTIPDIYFPAGAIKALGEQGEIGGYLVAYGSPEQRDKQGEYFTNQTDFLLDYYKERPVLFHHGLANEGPTAIGVITEIIPDERGLYARAKLWLNHADSAVRLLAQSVWRKVKQGLLGWSSGSLGHLVQVTRDGQILRWPIVEGSLTPTPAEPRRTHVEAIKTALSHLLSGSAIEAAAPTEHRRTTHFRKPPYAKGRTMFNQEVIDALREAGFDAEQILQVQGVIASASGGDAPMEEPLPEEPMMAEDEEELPEEEPMRAAVPVNGASSNGKAGGQFPPAPRANPLIVQMQKRMAKLEAQIKSAPAIETIPGRVNPKPAPTALALQVRGKWDNLSWEDMVFAKSLLEGVARARGGQTWQPENPGEFYRTLAVKMERAEGYVFSPSTIETIRAIKSDELNYSTQASYGDEFVPDLWRNVLWDKPRLDNPVFREMQVIEMPSDPYNIPVEGTDPTIFTVAETTNETQLGQNDSSAAIPDTKVGTANTTLNAGKLAARINISAELVEDSIIPVAQHWRFKAVRAMEDARDFVILSADATTGTSNINNDGGSIAATHRALYGGGDGVLHLPLVDNTAMGLSMGGVAPTLAKIRQARAKLNTEILADFPNLRYFCDPLTSVKLASVDELLNQSVSGMPSTVQTGFVGSIDSIPVYATSQMLLATATGVVSSTAGNNTLGRLLLVHTPSWYVGFRRNISVNLAFQPEYDAWVLVVSLRMALARRATDTAALLYNIAV